MAEENVEVVEAREGINAPVLGSIISCLDENGVEGVDILEGVVKEELVVLTLFVGAVGDEN